MPSVREEKIDNFPLIETGNCGRIWADFQPFMLRHYNTKRIVEMAAAALAFVLIPNIVNLGQLDVTNYGDRADYRSLDIPSVVEISGTETTSELTRRHREKVAQALENPFGLDAYVIVCAFSTFGHLIRFSYHRWLEEIYA